MSNMNSQITAPECPICSGHETPTGKTEVREQGRVYEEIRCDSCRSTGWEWSADRQPIVWVKKILPWMMLPFGMISGTSFVLMLVLGAQVLENRSIVDVIPFAVVGLFFGWIAFRPRVVRFEPATGRITVSWGSKYPWVYATYELTDWVSFDVKQVFPVVVFPSSSGVRTSSLPPYWQLRGKTKKGRSIEIGNFSSEDEAKVAREKL